MQSRPTALLIRDLSVGYTPGHLVLDEVNLRVEPKESVAIMGRSGSGKSTLVSCVLGLTRVYAGQIEVVGNQVDATRRRRAAQIRRKHIGVVFQSGALLPELSPLENVRVAGLLAGLSNQESSKRAHDLLEQLGVPAKDRRIGEFSGGEQQRVALARALVNRPQLILADEPTGSLDPDTRDEVCELLSGLPEEFDCGMVVVSHDPVVASVCTRVERLEMGRFGEALRASGDT